MEKMPTKQRVILAAMELFAEKGYDGVGVDQIADAVGIKGPSLYHHFKGKEEIFESILMSVERHYEENFGSAANISQFPETIDAFIESSLGRVNYTIHDENIRKVRKLLVMEQFRSEKVKELITKHQITGLVDLYSVIFEHMMNDGLIKKNNPKLVAFEFTTPISMLIQLVDREPEREQEVMEKIKEYINYFISIHEELPL